MCDCDEMWCCQAVAKTGVIFKELRALFDGLLERKLAEPALNIAGQ